MNRSLSIYGFLPMLMVIALGALPTNCGVRWRSHGIPAAIGAEQNAVCAGTESLSSGAKYASIPESDIDAAASPAASRRTPPSLWIWEGTRFHPADFRSSFKTRSSAKGSGSGNTANAKSCPAKGLKTAINLSCCSGDREHGSLNLARRKGCFRRCPRSARVGLLRLSRMRSSSLPVTSTEPSAQTISEWVRSTIHAGV